MQQTLECNGETVTTFLGTSGDDTYHGGTQHNAMASLEAFDVVGGNAGFDNVCGNEHDDVVTGDTYVTNGDDWQSPPAVDQKADYVDGGTGCDFVSGDGGDDEVRGNYGDDLHNYFGGCVANGLVERAGGVYGGDGDDQLYGGPGIDFVKGGNGTDVAYGGDAGTNYCHTSNESGFNCSQWVSIP